MDGVSMCNKERGIGAALVKDTYHLGTTCMGPSQGFGGTGGGAFLQGKHGNKEHEKINFRFLGNR